MIWGFESRRNTFDVFYDQTTHTISSYYWAVIGLKLDITSLKRKIAASTNEKEDWTQIIMYTFGWVWHGIYVWSP
jgi:hypothetical protein